MPAHFEIGMAIQAPPERVWEVLTDVERWPEWTPSVTRIKRLDNGPLRAGSRAEIRQPRLAQAAWTVTECNAATRTFTWETRRPGFRASGRHRVESDGAGSRLHLSLEFSGWLGGLLSRVYAGLNRRYMEYEARGLRDRCEGRI